MITSDRAVNQVDARNESVVRRVVSSVAVAIVEE